MTDCALSPLVLDFVHAKHPITTFHYAQDRSALYRLIYTLNLALDVRRGANRTKGRAALRVVR